MRGLSGSLRLFPRAEVSLCFREGAGALKTQNVRAEYYDLKAACVFNKAVWLFCSAKSSVRKFLHLRVRSSLHFHAFNNDKSHKSCLVCPPVLTLINKASQEVLENKLSKIVLIKLDFCIYCTRCEIFGIDKTCYIFNVRGHDLKSVQIVLMWLFIDCDCYFRQENSHLRRIPKIFLIKPT